MTDLEKTRQVLDKLLLDYKIKIYAVLPKLQTDSEYEK